MSEVSDLLKYDAYDLLKIQKWERAMNKLIDKVKEIDEIRNKLDKIYEELKEIEYRFSDLESRVKMSSPNIISEYEFLNFLNNKIIDETLIGKSVRLNEGDQTHDWIIIRVNSDSYDLWYNDRIGKAPWTSSKSINRLWTDTPTSGNTVRALCTQYRSKLSAGIQTRLRTGLNANCGDDLVVILSARQLGYTGDDYLNDDNEAIPYFNSDSKRKLCSFYWTSTAYSGNSCYLWMVDSDGTFSDHYYYFDAVVPAIRVGI